VGVHGKNRWIGTGIIVALGVILYVACIVVARNTYPELVG
jgi:cell division septation protein DedD